MFYYANISQERALIKLYIIILEVINVNKNNCNENQQCDKFKNNHENNENKNLEFSCELISECQKCQKNENNK